MAISTLACMAPLALQASEKPGEGLPVSQGREAFSQPIAGLNEAEREQFFRGRSLFRQSWVIAPAKDTLVGLGPLYNRVSCVSCHPKNGRGRAPDKEQERMQSMLVRLSMAGKGQHGEPIPHPAYGNQLNEEGIPGVPGEGIANIRWQEFSVTLADGTKVGMRKPHLNFHDLHYGDMGKVQTSLRVGSPVFGLGFLQAVAQTDLEQFAAEKKPNDVSGKINWVWNTETQQREAGRFGLKANTASLGLQTADAMLGDLGITSSTHPNENCTQPQTACTSAPSGGTPEVKDTQLADLEFYFQHLAAPDRRNANNPQVQQGEKIFQQLGCNACHRETLHTAKQERFTHLSEVTFHPYTDLLIHDMGEGLSDGRADFTATGRDWRTAPLWGIGLTELIDERQSYLHDGRARRLIEAILWHGGEAEYARKKYASLNVENRQALEKFLNSL